VPTNFGHMERGLSLLGETGQGFGEEWADTQDIKPLKIELRRGGEHQKQLRWRGSPMDRLNGEENRQPKPATYPHGVNFPRA